MRLATMAWANLLRKRGRTVFLLLAVAFSVGTLASMLTVTRAMRQEIGQAFDQIGANIVVLPQATRRYGYAGVALPGEAGEDQYLPAASENLVRAIKNKDNIAIVAPKLLAVVEAQGRPALAVGVRWPAELRLRKWWMIRTSPAGRPVTYIAPKSASGSGHDPSDAILGSQIAAGLGLDVGATVILGQVPFRVTGVLDPLGTDEDRAIWIDLGSLQGLTGLAGRISLLEVAALCNTCPIEEIVRQLTAILPGSQVAAVKAAVEARKSVVDRFARFAQALSAAVAALGALAVALTMLGSVRERTREIGILRALGFRRGHILSVLYLEAGVLGAAGGLAGTAGGAALARFIGPAVAGLPVTLPWEPLWLGAGAVGALVTMLLATTAAAVQAARIDPVKALRLL